jgi:NTP pyrophosphatase (non-canonical NTP hydrolase)
MELNDYQKKALVTKTYGAGMKIIYPTIKLNGEAGEVAEKVGKALRDNAGVFDDAKKLEIAKEIGDVLWYCSALADDIGYTLEQIAELNIAKLTSRKERDLIHGDGDNR